MPRRSRTLLRHATELSLAAPAVVAHRLGRIAMAGHRPSPRDRREVERMLAEKPLAFGEAWIAMTFGAWQAQQKLALAMLRAWTRPWTASSTRAWTNALQAAAVDVSAAGLAPIHAAATANARRLRRASQRRRR